MEITVTSNLCLITNVDVIQAWIVGWVALLWQVEMSTISLWTLLQCVQTRTTQWKMRERDRGGERGNVREDDVIQTSLMKVEVFFNAFFSIYKVSAATWIHLGHFTQLRTFLRKRKEKKQKNFLTATRRKAPWPNFFWWTSEKEKEADTTSSDSRWWAGVQRVRTEGQLSLVMAVHGDEAADF